MHIYYRIALFFTLKITATKVVQISVIASKIFCQHFQLLCFMTIRFYTKDVWKETETMWVKEDGNKNNESWLMWKPQLSEF